MTRYFRVIKVDGYKQNFGRYKSNKSPGDAVSKAATKWFHSNGSSSATFTLEEITRGSKKKQYQYRVKRRLPKPKEKYKSFKYKNVVESLNINRTK